VQVSLIVRSSWLRDYLFTVIKK